MYTVILAPPVMSSVPSVLLDLSLSQKSVSLVKLAAASALDMVLENVLHAPAVITQMEQENAWPVNLAAPLALDLVLENALSVLTVITQMDQAIAPLVMRAVPLALGLENVIVVKKMLPRMEIFVTSAQKDNMHQEECVQVKILILRKIDLLFFFRLR